MVLTALLHQQHFVVDTHILRVMTRVGVLKPGVRSLHEARKLLEPHIPTNMRVEMHAKLVALGQTVCRPRNPDCRECVLREACEHAASLPAGH